MFSKTTNSNLTSVTGFCISLCLILLTPLCFIYFISPTANTRVLWDWANALGYISISIALLLFIYSSKPLAYPKYTGKFFVNFHRDLGFIAMILVILHIAILLISEPILIEHLKLTAPAYMLAGLAAAALIIFIAFSSIRSSRKKLWKNYQQFRSIHNLLSILAVELIAVHIYISHFYLNHANKLLLLFIFCTIALAVYIKYKWLNKPTKSTIRKIPIDNKIATSISYGSLIFTTVFTLLLVFAKHLFAL